MKKINIFQRRSSAWEEIEKEIARVRKETEGEALILKIQEDYLIRIEH